MLSLVRVFSHELKIVNPIKLIDILKQFNKKYKDYIAAKVDGKTVDLTYLLNPDGQTHTVEFLECNDANKDALEILRHSAAHITAQAVLRLYKGAKLGVGPPIENGYYYDIEFPQNIGDDDLQKIEKEIKKIVKENINVERFYLSKQEAIELCKKSGQDYKVELLREDIQSDSVSFYKQGEFTDLCEGPHIPQTGYLENIKLERITGAYWKGNEKNKMLQRIYGTVFFTKTALEEYLKMLQEQKKRDHRILNKSLELFSIEEDAGSGLIFWHPNGAIMRYIIEDIWRKSHLKDDYKFVYSPHIANSKLWEVSGHLQYYKDNMYPLIELETHKVQLKPMNCPGHILIFKSRTRSYKELPLRFCELGTVYRYERAGVVGGLFRVRGFTQDDAHIFCEENKIEDEVIKVISFMQRFLRLFEFSSYKVSLSTRPEHFVGTVDMWDRAIEALKKALQQLNLQYEVDEGGGAFYGPKIDISIKDSMARFWQCSTVQVDFNLPNRFQLKYAGKDNVEHTPVMIHRALLGSLERFFGILIEHFAGSFPLWLSPVQVALIPVSENQINYMESLYNILNLKGIRCEKVFDKKNISSRIRECIIRKIPYMLIIGEAEEKQQQIALRTLKEGHIGNFSIDNFLSKIQLELIVPNI